MADVVSRVDWARRSAEFGPLEVFATRWSERYVVMPVHTPGLDDKELSWGLWQQWAGLPHHRRLLEPIQWTGELLVLYAAIDWTWQPGSIESERVARRVATWGIELTRVFDFIRVCTRESDLGWFTCPFAKVDIHGDLRVGFYNPAGSVDLMRRVPPDALESFPAANQPALVYAIGQLLLGLVTVTGKASQTPLGQVIMRCLASDPLKRFGTLAELRDALAIVGGNRNAHSPYDSDRAFVLADQAVGYLLLGMPERATLAMSQAAYLAPGQTMLNLAASLGIRIVQAEDKKPVVRRLDDRPPPPTKRTRNWREVRGTARMHVEAGRYADALALYDTSVLAEADAMEILVGTAECHLRAHEYGTAVDYAEQAIAREPKSAEAHAVLAEARFKRREFDHALAAVNLWSIALPADGHAHYVGAKALLGLGRLAEAREACERALELAPKHLPAMMLRRQIDRTIRRVRVQAGKAQNVPVDLPEHLRDLRPLLVAGKTAEAIAALERPEYASDPTAKLLRADLLAFTEQLEAAEAAYAALGGVAAGVGRALVLVKLGKATDALAVCDALIKEHPGAAEAHEARALALQQLGRGSEADEEMRRATAADRQRSQMRVQLAKR